MYSVARRRCGPTRAARVRPRSGPRGNSPRELNSPCSTRPCRVRFTSSTATSGYEFGTGSSPAPGPANGTRPTKAVCSDRAMRPSTGDPILDQGSPPRLASLRITSLHPALTGGVFAFRGTLHGTMPTSTYPLYTLRVLCHHEAGHAVCYWMTRHRAVRELVLTEGGETGGLCLCGPPFSDAGWRNSTSWHAPADGPRRRSCSVANHRGSCSPTPTPR